MDERPQVGGMAMLLRAMREEAPHFLALVQTNLDAQGDIGPTHAVVRECAAAMFGAAVGEAKRLARERGDQGDAELRRLVDTANALEAGLSHRLYLVWRMHFVDGRALTEYARAVGVHEFAARADFRDLVRVLESMMRQAGGARAGSEVALHLVARRGAPQPPYPGQER